MTDFAVPEISETTILRAENARLKMLLGHVLSISDAGIATTDEGKEGDSHLSEARRYASGDSGLQQILTQMVIAAIEQDRRTRREPLG